MATRYGVTSSLDGISFGAPPPDTPKITCLAWLGGSSGAGGSLYGCSSDEVNTGFSLGRSIDGRTWTPLFRLGKNIVGPLFCAKGTPVRDVCCDRWPTFAMQNMLDPNAATCMGNPPPPSAPSQSSGCSCQAGAGPRRGPVLGLLGAALLLLAWAARRLRVSVGRKGRRR